MTRVWLSGWEWACCGDPFAVGHRVEFSIATRGVSDELKAALGEQLARTVDAMESHHEANFPDRVGGLVTAVCEVTQEFLERRELRRPGHGAPPDAVPPRAGEEWPEVRREIGDGIFVGTRPSRYMVVSEPVQGTATLGSVQGVRQAVEHESAAGPHVNDVSADPPAERRAGRVIGWLVDVDEAV